MEAVESLLELSIVNLRISHKANPPVTLSLQSWITRIRMGKLWASFGKLVFSISGFALFKKEI